MRLEFYLHVLACIYDIMLTQRGHFCYRNYTHL